MTLTSTVAENTYIGSGTTGPFAVTFKFFAIAHLYVFTTDLNGSQTQLNWPTDFSVSPGAAGSKNGGSITLTNPLPMGWQLTIQRVVPLVQDSDFRNQGEFFPENYEDALDYLTMIAQQIAQPSGQQMAVADEFEAGTDFTAGTTTSLTLSQFPASPAAVTVTFRTSSTGGLVQHHTTYSVVGKTITFNAAIPVGTTEVQAQYFAAVVVSGFAADAANISYTAPYTGGVAESLAGKLAQVLEVRDFGAIGDGVTDDTVAFQKWLDAIPAGWTGTIAPTPLGTSYIISSPLSITKSIKIVGSVASLDNVTNHRNPCLQWTGGADVFLTISGTAVTGTKIKDIGFDNTGSGTVCIDIDATGEIMLEGVSIVSPVVPWSDSTVRVGNTANTTDIMLRDCALRNAAPIGLRVVQCSASIVVDHSHIMEHSVNNVLLGTLTTGVLDFQACNGATFEQTVNLDSVYIVRAQLARFDGCYFENSGTGFAINIPTGISLAEAIVSEGCWYSGIGGAVPYAINAQYASGDLIARDNHYSGFVTSFIKNGTMRRIIAVGNVTTNAGVPAYDSSTNLIGYGNIISGTITPPTGLLGSSNTIPGNPTNVLGLILGSSSIPSWVGTMESSGAVCLAFNALPTLGMDEWTQQNAAEASVLISLNGASGLKGVEIFVAAAGTAAGNLATFWGTSIFGASADTNAKVKLGASTSLVGFYGVTPIARPVLATGASHTVDDVITALQNVGLVKQS